MSTIGPLYRHAFRCCDAAALDSLASVCESKPTFTSLQLHSQSPAEDDGDDKEKEQRERCVSMGAVSSGTAVLVFL